MRQVFLLAFAAPLLAACSDGGDDASGANPFAGFSSALYEGTANWLCHPDLTPEANVCAGNLDATVVNADGSTRLLPHERAEDPAVDCFYVYPTVSADDGGNADLDRGDEEIFTTLNQAARYSRFCRVFAPVYRQITVNAIVSDAPTDAELAFGDVLDSFRHYIANHNNGRGYVLIGHSQGTGHLSRLLTETVEPDDYLREHMIAAHLIGLTIPLSEGTDTVSTSRDIQACRTTDETGCLVNYVSYREGDPFVADGTGRFGQPQDGDFAACVNPAAPSGGSAALTPYFSVASNPQLDAFIIERADGPFADPASAPPIATPFYTMPDFLRGECTTGPTGIRYFRITVNADPTDPRADDFNGEMVLRDWGLHLVDMTMAMGDLVELGASQARAWLDDRP